MIHFQTDPLPNLAQNRIRDLVRRDQEYAEKHRALVVAIDEARASGVSERDPFEYLVELRDGLRRRSEDADVA